MISEGDYVGRDIKDVSAELKSLGLKVQPVKLDNPGDQTEGIVDSLTPTGALDPGTQVSVSYWGKPPPETTQPTTPTTPTTPTDDDHADDRCDDRARRPDDAPAPPVPASRPDHVRRAARGRGETAVTGQLIGGRYELGELLGRGGMAEVRKGTDTRLGRVVAVKRLRTDLASDATFQARFRREAQSSASLNHPAIVAVYDTGEETATDGTGVAQPYIVMEYVAGRTLRDIIREGRKILPERALEITSGVLSALDYSHRAGIIHRDIKPGNVMLTPTGDVKVMDFGIARAMSDASSTMTQTAAVVGTAQYLSPEQARGENVDSALRRLLRRLPALRAAHRPAAVRRRLAGRRGLPARARARVPAVRPRHRPLARDRRDRDEGPGQAGRGPLPVGRRDAQRHRALPRRAAGARGRAAGAPAAAADPGHAGRRAAAGRRPRPGGRRAPQPPGAVDPAHPARARPHRRRGVPPAADVRVPARGRAGAQPDRAHRGRGAHRDRQRRARGRRRRVPRQRGRASATSSSSRTPTATPSSTRARRSTS